jgi:hypothetical protein
MFFMPASFVDMRFMRGGRGGGGGGGVIIACVENVAYAQARQIVNVTLLDKGNIGGSSTKF